jgi:thioredoxin-like negative regulator of GroEL
VIEQLLLADRLLTVDQVEQARQLYARVAQADPGNAIAVVGLARCALADGDDQRARSLADEALKIDPENDMARRMSMRLAEILAARIEPAARDGTVASGGTAAPAAPTRHAAPAAPTRPSAPVATRPSAPAATSTTPEGTEAPRRSFLERLRGR